jgi:flagellar biosynthesis chaperone FliJ
MIKSVGKSLDLLFTLSEFTIEFITISLKLLLFLSSSGDTEAAGEHSQAYYVIKAAQEKEELQRYGDELDGKLRKCEKEIKALANTLDHLKMRNKNYREKFIQGAEGADLEKKQILEDQCRAASETLFKKRRELQKMQKDYDDDARALMEIRTKSQTL